MTSFSLISMVRTYSTVEKRAKRMPDTTVETTQTFDVDQIEKCSWSNYAWWTVTVEEDRLNTTAWSPGAFI